METLRPPIANFETANLVVDERGSRLAYSGDEIMDLLKQRSAAPYHPPGEDPV